MTGVMLDSDICIHVMRRNAPEVLRRLSAFSPENVSISSIVAGELWVGVMKSRDRERSALAVKELLTLVEIVGWPPKAARAYGEIRAGLEAKGRPIGAMDMLIAAHPLPERATLVTRNLAEFARVEWPKVENWVAA